MHLFRVFLFLIIITTECYTRVNSTEQTTILFIPLDERFTTRSIVLNLARLIQQDFTLLTPPIELISYWKQPANPSILFQWLHDQISSLSSSCSLLISTEQLLYGGLINSRLSNTSLGAVHK